MKLRKGILISSGIFSFLLLSFLFLVTGIFSHKVLYNNIYLKNGVSSLNIKPMYSKAIEKGQANLLWDNSKGKYKISLDSSYLKDGRLFLSGIPDGDYTLTIGKDKVLGIHIDSILQARPFCKANLILSQLPCASWDVRKMLSNGPQGIIEAESYLNSNFQKNPDYEYVCHAAMHLVGSYALIYMKPEEAARSTQTSCDNGFLHGLIETLPLISSKVELKNIFGTLCNNIFPNLMEACFHGLGHGAYIKSGGDLFEGINYCTDVKGDFSKYFSNKNICAAGVSMQFANSRPLLSDDVRSKFLDKCKLVKDKDLANGCSEYMVDAYNDSFVSLEKAAKLCNESNFHFYCWYGLGFAVGYGNHYALNQGVTLCLEAKLSQDRSICYLYLMGIKIAYDRAVDIKGCQILAGRYEDLCKLGEDMVSGKVPSVA